MDQEEIQTHLSRRRPGQSTITTPCQEADQVEILSGLLDGLTLGTPIAMVVRNKDQRPGDYSAMAQTFRPSHADATSHAKYGIQARSGGGRASARETIARVAGGAIARQLLRHLHHTEVVAWVEQVHDIAARVDPLTVTMAQVDSTMVRCPDLPVAETMIHQGQGHGPGGGLPGGRGGLCGAPLPSGIGDAGIRQVGSRPGQGGDVLARHQRL